MPAPQFVGKFFTDFEPDPSAPFGFGSNDDQACTTCLMWLFCEGVDRLVVSSAGLRVLGDAGDHFIEGDYVPQATLRRLRSVVSVECSGPAGDAAEFLFEAYGFLAPVTIAFATPPSEEGATLTCDLPVAEKQEIRARWLADLASRPETLELRPVNRRPWWRWW